MSDADDTETSGDHSFFSSVQARNAARAHFGAHFGERAMGGGREPGRRGIPDDEFGPPPTPSMTDSNPDPSTPTTTTSSFGIPALVVKPIGPFDHMHTARNNMKLNRVILNGGIRVSDELRYYDDDDENNNNGTGTCVRVRVSFIGAGSRLFLDLVGPVPGRVPVPGPGQATASTATTTQSQPIRLLRTNGGEYFTNPREIVEAMRQVAGWEQKRNAKTHWMALVLYRDGHRVDTLSEVRESLRMEGRRGLEEHLYEGEEEHLYEGEEELQDDESEAAEDEESGSIDDDGEDDGDGDGDVDTDTNMDDGDEDTETG